MSRLRKKFSRRHGENIGNRISRGVGQRRGARAPEFGRARGDGSARGASRGGDRGDSCACFRSRRGMGEGSVALSSSSEAVTTTDAARDASSGDDGSPRETLEARRAALTRDIPTEPRPERPPDPPKTRRQLGLDFLRRDVSHAVRRAATVEPVGVGAPLSKARASDAVARWSTRRITCLLYTSPSPRDS